MTAAADSQVGASLQHFRLDRLLARGGMGEVYLGYDTSLERPVAVKLILPEFARQRDFMDRFLREARAQAQVAHSNVVQVYFVGLAGEMVFMAMELVDGGDLAGLIEQRKAPLDWKEAITHLLGLAEGLREASRLRIVHRDIKPQNILLDRFGLAHLADFGLAAPVGTSTPTGTGDAAATRPMAGAALPKLTQLGAVMGTPAYMSPEQTRGQALDHRSDIYSLGATFYELVGGRVPTQAHTLHALQEFHAGPPPPKLSRLVPHLPRPFADVIDRCMARDVAERFQTYDGLIAALRAAAPKPMVTASSVVRVLAWLIDLFVFLGAFRFTYQAFALAGVLTLAVFWLGGAALTGSSPGQWMMRLALRSVDDRRLSWGHLALRFVLQHGALAFFSLVAAALYQSSSPVLWLALGVVFALLAWGGSALAFFGPERRTLVDRLTGARVIVDVR